MAKDHTFSVTTDFPNGLNLDRFVQDLRDEPEITIALKGVNIRNDALTASFKDDLPSSQVAVLANVVSNHVPKPVKSAIEVVHLDAPSEDDNKPIFTISPSTVGMKTWITSAGDDVALGPAGRGQGPTMSHRFSGPGTFDIDFEFDEPVEIHDGQISWSPVDNWSIDDWFSLSIIIPATVATSTPGVGNVNAVQIGAGVYTYVPAAGDGSHTVDMTKAVVVPNPKENPPAPWAVDYKTGAISVATDEDSKTFLLLSFPKEVFFIPKITMGHPLGSFDVDVYKVDWIHNSWVFRIHVNKVTAGAGDVGGWLLVFRNNNTRT